MKLSFLPVRQAAFQILQRAGHIGLAVSLENRQINQEIRIKRLTANFHRPEPGFHGPSFFLFQIVKWNIVFLADFVIAAGFHGAIGFISDPGAFNDADFSKAIVLKIRNASR